MPLVLQEMRWQIAVAYTLLIVLTLAGLASVLFAVSRSTYLRTLENGVVGQAHLVAKLAERASTDAGGAELDALVDSVGQQLAARVTLISPDGTIVADSLLPPDRYSTRRDRPEVLEALRLGLGETERYSTTTGDDRFYVAVPFERDGLVAGIARVGVPLTTIVATQDQIALAILAAALIAAVVSLVLAVLLARRTTRPLLELRTMAERLAGGDLDVRVPVPSGEEVGALAKSFNQMASRLRLLIDAQSRERERLETILATMHDGILILEADSRVTLTNRAAASAVGITKPVPFAIDDLSVGPAILDAARASDAGKGPDATELIDELIPPETGRSLRAIVTRLGDRADSQTLVLLQDLTELRRVERSRRMLLTNITHDLRTPLASLQALLDALSDGAIDEPEVAREFLGRMQVEVRGMSRLVNDFLELSRIERGQVTLRHAPTDVRELLRAVAARMEAQARQKGVGVVVDVAEDLPILHIDGARIEQVLLNLLQNALTYTSSGGRITLTARAQRGATVITVRDTGSGIEAEDLPYIFDRFYKADLSRSVGGEGLGLAIAKHLVEHHRGRIWAESAPGIGTTISFTLPVRRARGAEQV